MDLKRISSGIIVGIAVIILLLIPNNFITSILLAIVAIVSMYEYLKAISKVCKPVKWIGYITCILVAVINIIPKQYLLQVFTYLIPTTILILFLHIIVTEMKISFKDIAYTFLGICYIPIFIMFLSLINGMNNGKILLGYVFITAWGTDIFAYSIGCRFGKHKFSKVSPKKSIEGCIAGTVGSTLIVILYTLILNKYFEFNYSYIIISISSIILSLIGQIGDFSASAIKRYVDIRL